MMNGAMMRLMGTSFRNVWIGVWFGGRIISASTLPHYLDLLPSVTGRML